MPPFGPVLAERRLAEQGSGAVVRVSLGAPRRGTGGARWACPFRIRGAGLSRVECGYGEDSMQAIANALEGIRALLDESGLSLGWKLGIATWDGETGFTRSIPFALGPAFRKRLERLVDAELEREVQRLEGRSTRKSKPAPRPARAAARLRKRPKAR